jgi:MHS family proline/betaine transporter-like MFS transporter
VTEAGTSHWRALAAASAGNLLEWYDFTVYALFAAYLSHAFFPSQDPVAALISTFMAFGVGFVVRPLGAAMIGAFGDRAGRKAALTLTILLMAIGTLILAAAPTYATIGLAAPALLLIGRLLQGLSAGGEIGSAAAYLAESAPAGKIGATASWLEASMGMSNILGALVAVVTSATLSTPQLQRWGWRIPFIVGLAIVPVGWVLRRELSEPAIFERERARRRAAHSASPLREVLQAHWRSLLIGLGLSVLWAVAVYVLIVFLPVFVQRNFSFSALQAFTASLIGNVPFVGVCLITGRLSDRLGRATMLGASAAALILTTLPAMLWLQSHHTLLALTLVQSWFCVVVATFVGSAPAAVAELFPTSVRSTGIALVYNVAFTLFGGFAPAILTWLTRQGGSAAMAPGWYVMAGALMGAVATVAFARRRSPSSAQESLADNYLRGTP